MSHYKLLLTNAAVLMGIAVLAGGCSSHQQKGRAPDWTSESVAPITLAAPAQAVVAVDLPVEESNRVSAVPVPHPLPIGAERWIALDRWCKTSGLPAPARLAVSPTPSYALHAPQGVLTFHAGSQAAQWDGAELRLGFAPQCIDGHPFIHALDLKKNLQPLLADSPFLPHKNSATIVIDPGHGGENAGTKSVLGDRYEKEFTLDWARRLQGLLLANGWQAFLTRSNDAELSLSQRITVADEHHAALFLSLHFNSAAPDTSQAGLETYCLTPAGMASSVTRGFADDSTQVFPNNDFDESNLQIALRIHRALLQLHGQKDRGVRRARFLSVLRGQQRPAVLVEGGYLSNPHEAKLIAEPSYRQQLAQAVASALE